MNIINVATRIELREWLQKNHLLAGDGWVYITKIPYLDIVLECLCFGWIDSTKKRVDDGTVQRISPRRKGGNWTELNFERVRRLEKMGLMTEQGRNVLPDRFAEDFVISPKLETVLRSDATLWEQFCKLPSLYQRVRLDNIQNLLPKQIELYEQRLEKFILHTREGKLYGDWNDGGKLVDY